MNRHFGGDDFPTGRLLEDLAAHLVRREHAVSVLASADRREGEARGVAVEVSTAWGVRSGSKLWNWIIFWAQTCVRVPFRRWDVLVLMTDPPFMVLAAMLSRFWGGKRRVVLWTMDLYPECLAAHGMIRPRSIAYRSLRALNNLAFRSVDTVICLDAGQHRRLLEYSSLRRSEIHVEIVRPWDLRIFPSVDREQNRFLREHGLSEFKLALYAGNLGKAHSFTELLEGARELHARGHREWRIVFVVQGAQRPALMKAAHDLTNVLVLDYHPADWVADLLWAADVHLITLQDGWEGIAVPSKLYAALQTGAPSLFIGPAECGTAQEITRRKLGDVLPPRSDGQLVAHTLLKLADRGRGGRAPQSREEVLRVGDSIVGVRHVDQVALIQSVAQRSD